MRKLVRLLARPVNRRLAWLLALLGGEAGARRRHARKLARLMRSELTRLGFSSRGDTRKTRNKRTTVRFEDPCLLTPDELWCPIDLRRFPAKKTTNDLRDPDVLQDLRDRLHANVRVDTLANGKLCLVARVRAAQFPTSYSIDKFQLPPDAPLLAFPLGIDADGEHRWADLTEVKHLLIAGATGGGKTTFMHTLLYTFINRCTEEELELWLIDLKGQEFGKYEKLMGSKSRAGIVHAFAHEPEKALEVLDQAVKEIKRRNKLMKDYDASNLSDLAHLSGQRLRRVVVAIDEVAVLSLDRERVGKHTVGSWAQHLITQIAALGRAVGVHSVIATQHINKEVLTGLILANFETRVCFSTADWRKSQLIIETSEANSIPTGRMLWRHLGQTVEHQAPLITPSQLRLEVTRIANNGPDGGLGDKDELAHFVRNAKLIVQTACDQFDGKCTISKLYQAEGIRGILSKAEVEETCRRLERDGVLEPGTNRKPRQVARGFYKMPELLDMRYGGTASASQDAAQDAQDAARTLPGRCDENAQRPENEDQRPGCYNAENQRPENTDSASCVLQNNLPPAQNEAAEIEAQIQATVKEIRDMADDHPELRAGLERSAFGSVLGLTEETVYSIAYRSNGQQMSLVVTHDGQRGVAAYTSHSAAEAQARARNLPEWGIIPDARSGLEARARNFNIGVHIIEEEVHVES